MYRYKLFILRSRYGLL